MSHVTTIEIEIRDLECLDQACRRLGLELVRDQKTFKWFGRSVGDYPIPKGFTKEDLGKCLHAIRVPGNQQAYEIGVVQRRDGRAGYSLMWDFYAGGFGMEEKVGSNCQKLRQAYATAVAIKSARAQGFAVQEMQGKNGAIVINITKP